MACTDEILMEVKKAAGA